jgi:hypothetical protein
MVKLRVVGSDGEGTETIDELWTKAIASHLKEIAAVVHKKEGAHASGLAVVITYSNGDLGTFFTAQNPYYLVGALEELKLQVMAKEEEDEPEE